MGYYVKLQDQSHRIQRGRKIPCRDIYFFANEDSQCTSSAEEQLIHQELLQKLRFSQITLQTTTFSKFYRTSRSILKKSETRFLFSEPAFRDPENRLFLFCFVFWVFFGRSVDGMKDLGEKHEVVSCLFNLTFSHLVST